MGIKDIIDTIVLIIFIFMLFMILRGFNKEQIQKHQDILEEANKRRKQKEANKND
jgi:uncharacterized membrane protein